MCTVTLSYDQNNALARRKLAALLATRTRHRDLLNLQNQTKMILHNAFNIRCIGHFPLLLRGVHPK